MEKYFHSSNLVEIFFHHSSVFGAGAALFLTAPAPAPAPSKTFQRLRLRLRPKCVGSGDSGSGSGSGSASLPDMVNKTGQGREGQCMAVQGQAGKGRARLGGPWQNWQSMYRAWPGRFVQGRVSEKRIKNCIVKITDDVSEKNDESQGRIQDFSQGNARMLLNSVSWAVKLCPRGGRPP